MSSPAFAQETCGPLDQGKVTCPTSGNPYPNGINYTAPQDPVEDLTVVLDTGVAVSTTGNTGITITGNGTSNVTLAGSGASVTTEGAAGIVAGIDAGDLSIAIGDVTTVGNGAHGIDASLGSGVTTITAGMITTTGDDSSGIRASGLPAERINVAVDRVTTSGSSSDGVAVIGGADVRIDVTGAVTVAGTNATAINAILGDAVVINAGGPIRATGAYARAINMVSGTIDLTATDVSTSGTFADAINAFGFGEVNITTTGLVSTAESNSIAINARSTTGRFDTNIAVKDVTTLGDFSIGVAAAGRNANVTINGTIRTDGYLSRAVLATGYTQGVTITNNGTVSTSGVLGTGLYASAPGEIRITNNGSLLVTGEYAEAINARSSDGSIVISSPGTIVATNFAGVGIRAVASGESNAAGVGIDVASVDVAGNNGAGIIGIAAGGNVSIRSTGSIISRGAFAPGIYASSQNGSTNVLVNNVTTERDQSPAILASGRSATVTVNGAVQTAGSISPNSSDPDAVVSAVGVFARGTAGTSTVAVAGSVKTTGSAAAIQATSTDGTVIGNTGTIETTGADAPGINASSEATVVVNSAGVINTTGARSAGIVANGATGVTVTAAKVATAGTASDGIIATTTAASAPVRLDVGAVQVTGVASKAIRVAGTGDVTLSVSGPITSSQDEAVTITTTGLAGVNNTKGGTIGGQSGLIIDAAAGASITNAGMITSGSGFALSLTGGNATIMNSGTLAGRLRLGAGSDSLTNVAGGRIQISGDNDFGAGSDILTNAGSLIMTASSPASATFLNLERTINSGLIDLRNGRAGDVLTLTGSFSGSSGSTVGLDVATAGGTVVVDRLVVGTATGTTQITLNLTGTPLLTTGTTLVQAGTGSSSTAFSLASDTGNALVDYRLAFVDNAYQLIGTPGTAAIGVTRIPEAMQNLWHRSAEAITSHLAAVSDGGRAGPWLSGFSTSNTRDDARDGAFGTSKRYETGYRQNTMGILGGLDFGSLSGARGAIGGLTIGYANSTQNMRGSDNRNKLQSFGGGVYGRFATRGVFFDGSAEYHRVKVDARIPLQNTQRNIDGSTYGVTAEVGTRLNWADTLIEPMATLAYVRNDLDSLDVGGMTIRFDDTDGLRGKLGVRAAHAWQRPNGATFALYGTAAAVHEFKGQYRTTFTSGGTSLDLTSNRIGTYAQGMLGLRYTSTRGFGAFVEGTGDFGDYKGGGGRIGVHFGF